MEKCLKNVFGLRNRKISAYGDPIVTIASKEQMAKDLSRFCMVEPQEAKKAHYDESELFLIGTYDDEQGKIVPLQENEFICSFDNLFITNTKA